MVLQPQVDGLVGMVAERTGLPRDEVQARLASALEAWLSVEADLGARTFRTILWDQPLRIRNPERFPLATFAELPLAPGPDPDEEPTG
jgi:hypothetical protein